MCSFSWTAIWGQKNLSCMRSSMCSRPKWPTSSWHPLRATSLCAVGKTNCKRVSFDSLGLAHQYKTPFWSTRLFCSILYWLNLGESVFLDQSCWSVPSLSLFTIIPKTGSTSWAWCQSSRVIWATCWLSWIALWHASHSCKPLWGKQAGLRQPPGLPLWLLHLPLDWYPNCQACT